MTSSKKELLTAVFRNHNDAQQVFDWLVQRGYQSREVNFLVSEQTRKAYFRDGDEGPVKAGTHMAEGMAVGGAVGTAVGATVAAILAAGTALAIPGLGMIIAGPIVAALAGGGAGAVAGGAIGTLVGLGIPESNAKAYEQALREGGVVVGVTPRNSDEGSKIKKYFEAHHGENIVYAA
jgi:hypothetical protein